MSKIRLPTIAASSFLTFVCTTAIQPPIVQATEVPTTATSIDKAPYSEVFYTGAAYAVKDRDFKGDDPSLGFSTVWIDNPTTDKFQVGVRYCLPDNSLTDSGVYLRSIELMSDNQPLVKIDRLVFATSVQEKLLRPGYYSEDFDDPFWDDGAFYGQFDPFWGNIAYRYDEPPVYVSPSSCSAGSSRFDLSPLVNAIAQLPSKKLQVRLVFSDGETSNWH
jgi:hypothetical protein